MRTLQPPAEISKEHGGRDRIGSVKGFTKMQALEIITARGSD
jgi:hypothetical protein